MKFFDANILYGIPSQNRLYPAVPDRVELLLKLREFGIEKAIVHREEQFFNHPHTGNMLLAEDIKDTPELFGVWTMLPPHCHEMPEPEEMLAVMQKNRIVGWQLFPRENQYILHWRVLKVWFELAQKHHIPLFIDFGHVAECELFEVMDKYPELTVILRNASVWPPDRILRPFLTEFPQAYMELSNYLVPGGLEDLIAHGYRDRIVYSSHYQASHVGGPMMLLKHASISETDKELIAAGNLERILGRIDYV